MNEAASISERRYRRRVLGLGSFVFLLVFAVGAAIFIPAVERDLEDRVTDVLVDAAIDGVSVSFSGQDGTLSCATPPEVTVDLIRLASDVDGVRTIELDGSCVAGAIESADGGASPASTDAPGRTSTVGTDGETTVTAVPDSTAPVDVESVLDVVDRDPLFGTLAGLLDDADLTGADALGGPGPFTLLAPTDAAFDAAFDEIGADAFQELVDDPERLRTLLLHHVTEGSLGSAELEPGELVMLDGTSVRVDNEPGTQALVFTSGESTASVDDPLTQLDINTSNGVIHAIDRLLVPAGLEFGTDAPLTPVVAVLSGDSVVVTGTVASEAQRNVVVVASSLVDVADVADQLVVDVGADVDEDAIELFGRSIGALDSMVSGEVRLVDGVVQVTGVATDAFAAEVLDDFGADNGVDVDVSVVDRSVEVAALQDELDALVLRTPVEFEPGSAEVDPVSNDVLADIVEIARGVDGVTIRVVGHTDTGGTPSANLALSQARADAVRFLLVVLGLDPDAVTAIGVGGAEPVIVDGREDEAASRRVEFVVEAVEP